MRLLVWNKGIEMILTVCLSPCIDVNIEVDSLSVGKNNTIISKTIFFTGKAINVAIGVARLNSAVFATGFMYEGNGSQFEHELHKEGVPYKFVWSEGRVRENYKFIDHRSMLTEVNDISPAVSEQKQAELLDMIKNLSAKCEAVVISGSLAKGMTPDYYGKILESVPDGILKIVDTEGDRLLCSLEHGVDLVNRNIIELERTLKRKLRTKAEMLDGCRRLIDKGAKRVLLSLGKNGAIITDGIQTLYSKSVNVAMNSTIGAGDGMVAAASNALVKGQPLDIILRSGVAAGTAAVTSPDCISFNKSKFDEIFSTLSVKEI